MTAESAIFEMLAKLSKLEGQKALMRKYLQLKVDEDDYHGCADAAMDLRDIDSEIKSLHTAIGITEKCVAPTENSGS